MGLRFRKLIRLAKPLALTLSNGGPGVRVGLPGANVTLRSNGAALHLGLPGSGLSYRAPLTGTPRAEYRAYRAALREEKEARRAEARAEDAVAHAEAEAYLTALDGVLAARERSTFDLWKVLDDTDDAPFLPSAIARPMFEPDLSAVHAEAARAHPDTGYDFVPVVLACVGAVAWMVAEAPESLEAMAVGRPGMHETWKWVIAGAVAGAVFLRAVRQMRRSSLVKHTIERQRVAYDLETLELRATHEREERAAWEAARAQLRSARETLRRQLAAGDAGPLGELFERVLAGFEWPVPVVADVTFDGLSRAEIELVLPELDDIPETRTSLTTRGKLSRKAMPKGERVRRFEDLCCGLALRLVHDTFRFSPTFQQVQVRGTATRADVFGNDESFVALVLELDRETFSRCDLDRLDPSALVSTLGRWGGNRRGALTSVV